MIKEKTVRWLSYPAVMGLVIAAELMILYNDLPYWPLSPLIVAAGILCVALLERVQPYQAEWNQDHNDTLVDVLHAAFSLTLIIAVVEIVAITRELLPIASLWPPQLGIVWQLLIAGLIIDFGLWFMHWLSHKSDILWRLHALHHSSERLYWLNGERRHPLSAVLLASPGLMVTILLGAPASVIGAWFAIVGVHLAFQHANLNYTVGAFRKLLGVAEVHRWHHKREFEDAQVNYGEFWMLWDQLFGTYREGQNGVVAGDVGIRESMPLGYIAQLAWPFQSKYSLNTSSNKHIAKK